MKRPVSVSSVSARYVTGQELHATVRIMQESKHLTTLRLHILRLRDSLGLPSDSELVVTFSRDWIFIHRLHENCCAWRLPELVDALRVRGMDRQEMTARLSRLRALGVVDVRPIGNEVAWFLEDSFQDKVLDRIAVEIKKRDKDDAADIAYEAMCEFLTALPISKTDVQELGEVLWPIVERGARGMWEPTLEAA